MAQTFKDYLVESEMYAHSKEHYELMKECAELALLEQYIADQEFIIENASFIYESGQVNIEDGYFNESAVITDAINSYMEAGRSKKPIQNAADTVEDLKDKADGMINDAKDQAKDMTGDIKNKASKKLDEIKNAANTKKAGIMDRIMKGWKKCLDIAISIFTKIVNFCTSIGQDAAAITKVLKTKTLNQDDVDNIDAFIKASRKTAKWQYADKDQPFAGDMAITIAEGVNMPMTTKTLTAYLAAALSDSSVIVKPRELKSMNNVVDAMDIDEIIKLADGLNKHKKKYTIDAVANQIDGAKASASQDGIKLYANDKHLGNVVAKLKKLRDDLDSANNAAVTGDASVMSGTNDVYTRIRNSMTCTINLYSGYLTYRKTLIAKLKGYFNNNNSSAD